MLSSAASPMRSCASASSSSATCSASGRSTRTSTAEVALSGVTATRLMRSSGTRETSWIESTAPSEDTQRRGKMRSRSACRAYSIEEIGARSISPSSKRAFRSVGTPAISSTSASRSKKSGAMLTYEIRPRRITTSAQGSRNGGPDPARRSEPVSRSAGRASRQARRHEGLRRRSGSGSRSSTATSARTATCRRTSSRASPPHAACAPATGLSRPSPQLVVESVPLHRDAARGLDHTNELFDLLLGLGPRAGGVEDLLPHDRSLNVVCAEMQGNLRERKAHHDPVGLDVRDVVEEEPRHRHHLEIVGAVRVLPAAPLEDGVLRVERKRDEREKPASLV